MTCHGAASDQHRVFEVVAVGQVDLGIDLLPGNAQPEHDDGSLDVTTFLALDLPHSYQGAFH